MDAFHLIGGGGLEHSCPFRERVLQPVFSCPSPLVKRGGLACRTKVGHKRARARQLGGCRGFGFIDLGRREGGCAIFEETIPAGV